MKGKPPSFAQRRATLEQADTPDAWLHAATELVVHGSRKRLEERLELVGRRVHTLDSMAAGLLWFHVVWAGRRYSNARWIAMASDYLSRQLPGAEPLVRMGHLMTDGWNYTSFLDYHMKRTLMVLQSDTLTWPGKTQSQVLSAVDLPLLRQAMETETPTGRSASLDTLIGALGPEIKTWPVVARWTDACQLDGAKSTPLMEARLARLLLAGAGLETIDKHGKTALEGVVNQGWESEKSVQVIDVLVRAGARWDHIDPYGVIEPLRVALWGHPWVRRAQLLGRARAGRTTPPGRRAL